MLARACEHHARKHVNKLLTCCKALWELVIDVALSHRKAILVQVLNPRLKFVVLDNPIIRLIVD